jgi:Domain of unknown function (DUF4437)
MMMRMVVIGALLSVLLCPPRVHTKNANQTVMPDPQVRWELFKPDQMSWRDGPPSLLPGAKVTILEGDPTKEGFFTMRLKLPDGYRVFPHWHPRTERLTIISGILNLGTGDSFDPSATQAFPAGTYSSMPPKMSHFAWMTGETVLQLSSIGPWEVVYVNSADDPRIRAK